MRLKFFLVSIFFVIISKISLYPADIFQFSIEIQEINFDGNISKTNYKAFVYFYDNKVKISLDESFSIVIDTSKEKVFFAEDKAKFYWELDFENLREKNQDVAEKIFEALKHNLIKDEREKLIFLLFLFNRNLKDEENEMKIPAPQVLFSTDEKEIAGYKANNIKLTFGRKIFFEFWNASSIKSSIDCVEILKKLSMLPESATNLIRNKTCFPVAGRLECPIWGKRFIIAFSLEKFYNEKKDVEFFAIPKDYTKKDEFELDNIIIRRKE